MQVELGTMWKAKKKHTGKCVNCGSLMELLELNAQKNSRILECTACGFKIIYIMNISIQINGYP